ncbi:MAG: XRE family transcriptional regulator [Proteobacteria bacterium]|nr:XRE family transcriptional regulator [Pseudomonadota bacterium]
MTTEIDQNDAQIVESCGNVFIDLGFPAEEAEIYALRCELMNRLEQVLLQRGWTSQEVAKRLNIGVIRASELLNGKWQNFSLDMLITIAARIGLKAKMELIETA